MAKSALETFVENVRADWGPLTSEVAAACSHHLAVLLQAHVSEEWLADLIAKPQLSKELWRDPDHGFLLLAHAEPDGLYRPPHDHGRSWVIYGVQHGESEMGTYGRLEASDGTLRLVKRNATLVQPGQVQVYLPGDIHDTRSVAGPALLFRFTERDLKHEDDEEHKVTRYVERNGVWTVGRP
jgi:hypothetical protein